MSVSSSPQGPQSSHTYHTNLGQHHLFKTCTCIARANATSTSWELRYMDKDTETISKRGGHAARNTGLSIQSNLICTNKDHQLDNKKFRLGLTTESETITHIMSVPIAKSRVCRRIRVSIRCRCHPPPRLWDGRYWGRWKHAICTHLRQSTLVMIHCRSHHGTTRSQHGLEIVWLDIGCTHLESV